MDYYLELKRCDHEQSQIRILYPNAPLWLDVLGTMDWERERKLIIQEMKEQTWLAFGIEEKKKEET